MSPFYAFITLDMPEPVDRVHPLLSASSRNIERAALCPQLRFLPFSDTNIKLDYMAERKQMLPEVNFFPSTH